MGCAKLGRGKAPYGNSRFFCKVCEPTKTTFKLSRGGTMKHAVFEHDGGIAYGFIESECELEEATCLFYFTEDDDDPLQISTEYVRILLQ